MASGQYNTLTLTLIAAGVLSANRFITQAGAYPAAGGKVFGVTRFSTAAAGEPVSVDVHGTSAVEAGAAIAFDQDVTTDAQGRIVPLTAGKIPVGRAMEAGLAAGAMVEILLIPTVAAAAA